MDYMRHVELLCFKGMDVMYMYIMLLKTFARSKVKIASNLAYIKVATDMTAFICLF
jgi:hypothetical protein